jgi:ferredoxin
MIFYYTATGNCLYVAKNLEKEILSIPQELKKNELNYKDKKIGIVAPVYAGELPKTVRRFIKKANFETDYFYMVLTYGKNDTVATTWCEDFCKKNGIHLDYAHTILMVDNYLPSFDMKVEIEIEKKVDEQIKLIQKDIEQRIEFIPQPNQAAKKLYATASQRYEKHPELINGESIIMTDRCVGCKICEQVCPIGNIKIENGISKRLHRTCDFCLACVHHCPFKAIDLVTDKNPEARYRHEKISLKEIVQSNHQ